jgi:predicted phosphodiesterase
LKRFWAAALLLGCVGSPAHAQVIRIHFLSDVHSQDGAMEQFIAAVRRDRPHLVLEGGDMVHDGTESEYRRAFEQRARLGVPWRGVRGNHDALLRGPHTDGPPRFPLTDAFEYGDLRVLLLDSHDERISDAQFTWLAAELEASAGRRVIVVMHVPPIVSRKPPLLALRRLVPFHLANPAMPDAAEAERFMELMERHAVLAVLAGHTHFFDQQVLGGVHYIIAGAAGGHTPGLGIANEFLAIEIDGRDISIRRERLRSPAGNPLRLVARTFGFYAGLNAANHAEQGWNYVPSVSLQLRSGLEIVDDAEPDRIAWHGAASFERVLGRAGRRSLGVDLGLTLGGDEAFAHVSAGHLLRVLGSFNRNTYIAAAATADAGRIAGALTAAPGLQLGAGVEWHGVTAELRRGWSTRRSALAVVFGHRY